MAAIVLVHGIDYQRLKPDDVVDEWGPALARGVRLAGLGDLADRLWPQGSRPNSIEIRAAYYGDFFRMLDEQGGGGEVHQSTPDDGAFSERLALEWLERIANGARATSADRARAQFALDLARNPEALERQGMGEVWRQIINTLARNTWLGTVGMDFAQRFVLTALNQVTLYLTSEPIRAGAQQKVLHLVDDDTRIIIGHSLGSVVAYECAHRLSRSLPLLLTLGSPLGLRTIVLDRLRPPPSFPPKVNRWVNVADRDDVVAAAPDLSSLFAGELRASARFNGILVDNGSKPHDCRIYLGHIAVGRVISEALS